MTTTSPTIAIDATRPSAITYTVRLRSRRFYDDHVARDLPAGRIVRETKTTITVELDEEAFDDLLSDAFHYTSLDTYGDRFLAGLRSSARSTYALLAIAREAAQS